MERENKAAVPFDMREFLSKELFYIFLQYLFFKIWRQRNVDKSKLKRTVR